MKKRKKKKIKKKQPVDSGVRFVIRKTKRLSELTASGVPRGLDPEDVAIDFD